MASRARPSMCSRTHACSSTHSPRVQGMAGNGPFFPFLYFASVCSRVGARTSALERRSENSWESILAFCQVDSREGIWSQISRLRCLRPFVRSQTSTCQSGPFLPAYRPCWPECKTLSSWPFKGLFTLHLVPAASLWPLFVQLKGVCQV